MQILVFPKFSYTVIHGVCLNLLRNIYNEKCTQSTISMPKTLTQIRPDDWTKDERKAQRQ